MEPRNLKQTDRDERGCALAQKGWKKEENESESEKREENRGSKQV